MPRFALLIEYDGGPFSGWQAQRDLPTVQGALEAAIARIAPEAPRTAAAGRTDAGVHATGQVAHVDLARNWDPFRLAEALNHHLKPAPVAVRAVARVADDWHARFSARERRYLYRILVRRAPPVLDRGRVWHLRAPLDAGAMREAAGHLLGRHDFTTFRSSECQADSPVRTLDAVEIKEIGGEGETEIRLRLRARSFLHAQVRSIAGSLERVGRGAWSSLDLKAALEARDRAACGPVAPPQGLVLTRVSYAAPVFDLKP